MVDGNDSQNWPVKRFCCKFVIEKYQFRKELKNLTQELEDWEWHENRDLESKVVLLILVDLVTYETILHICEGSLGAIFLPGQRKDVLRSRGPSLPGEQSFTKKDFFMQQFFYSNHNHCLSIRSPQLSATPCQNSLRLWTVPYVRWARHLHALEWHIEFW